MVLLLGIVVCPAGATERLDFWVGALGQFGNAQMGDDLIAPRRDPAYTLDYADKRMGDFSVLYVQAQAKEDSFLGFTAGPYQKTWNLMPTCSLHMWVKATEGDSLASGQMVLTDDQGHSLRTDIPKLVSTGKWVELIVPLADFAGDQIFRFNATRSCRLEAKLSQNAQVRFDGVCFVDPKTRNELGVTDKTVEQRMAEAEASREDRIKEAFEIEAEGTVDSYLYNRFARLWLGRDVEKINKELLHIFTTDDPATRSEYGIEDQWSLLLSPLLIRYYYNFSSKSSRMPGRITPQVEKALLELLWQRTVRKNDIHLARQSTWWLSGSENHDINAKVCDLISSQIFMHLPEYADRIYPDEGHGGGSGFWFHRIPDERHFHGPEGRGNFKDGKQYNARDHYEAWVKFLDEYITERARKGFFVETCSPGYMKWTITFLRDIYDFCEDAALRKKMGMFMDVIWADWAQDELSGLRGGAKTRDKGYSDKRLDSMYIRAQFLLGGPAGRYMLMGPDGDRVTFIAELLSEYRLPRLIWRLALDREGLGDYAFISRRPGEESDRLPRPLGQERTTLCDTESRYLRYSWVTPAYILGTQMDHPYALHCHLSVASRWHGMTFVAPEISRVYPRPIQVGDDGVWEMGQEGYYRSVQHRNVLITQQAWSWNWVSPDWFPHRSQYALPYGIFLGDRYDRLEEKAGWIFVQQGNGYLAVRVLAGEADKNARIWKDYQANENLYSKIMTDTYQWNDQHTIIRFKNKFSPIIFEAGARANYPTLKDFQNDILDNPLQLRKTVVPGWYIVLYTGCGEEAKDLYFNAANTEIPMVAGRYLDYAPDFLFQSPYLDAKYNDGVITIKKGEDQLVLDFNE